MRPWWSVLQQCAFARGEWRGTLPIPEGFQIRIARTRTQHGAVKGAASHLQRQYVGGRTYPNKILWGGALEDEASCSCEGVFFRPRAHVGAWVESNNAGDDGCGLLLPSRTFSCKRADVRGASSCLEVHIGHVSPKGGTLRSAIFPCYGELWVQIWLLSPSCGYNSHPATLN